MKWTEFLLISSVMKTVFFLVPCEMSIAYLDFDTKYKCYKQGLRWFEMEDQDLSYFKWNKNDLRWFEVKWTRLRWFKALQTSIGNSKVIKFSFENLFFLDIECLIFFWKNPLQMKWAWFISISWHRKQDDAPKRIS